MSDNPFDDLEIDDSSDDTASETTTESEPELTEPVSGESQSVREPQRASAVEDDISGPAFEYAQVRQKPLYARDETWNRVDDELGITVTPALRRMGIRDEETREIHDALLRVALEHIDEVPNVVADARLE